MNPEIKAQWCADLRSGEYKQGRGVLHYIGIDGAQDTYCCLGVLMEQAVRAGIIKRNQSGAYYALVLDEDGETRTENSLLMREVVEWAGLSDSNPSVMMDEAEWGKARVSLSAVNDQVEDHPIHRDFRGIADLIEAIL